MATIKINNVTALTESGGVITLDNAITGGAGLSGSSSLGTVTAGTINNTVTGDGVACVKLYSITDPGAQSVNINGFFDDTVYSHYRLMATDMRVASGNHYPYMRVMTGGSPNSTLNYWTCGGGWYNNNGAMAVQDRADNDGDNYAHMGATWNMSTTASNSSSHQILFGGPQSSTARKQFWVTSWGDAHGGNDDYKWINNLLISFEATTAMTGISFYSSGGTISEGTVSLYGYRK
jgi:hypothetical protein